MLRELTKGASLLKCLLGLAVCGEVRDLWSSSTFAQIRLHFYLLEAFSFRNSLVLIWVLNGNACPRTRPHSEPQALRLHHFCGGSLCTVSLTPKVLRRCSALPLWRLPCSAGKVAMWPTLSSVLLMTFLCTRSPPRLQGGVTGTRLPFVPFVSPKYGVTLPESQT